MAHLLIVDDEQSVCWAMSKLAEQLGHTASVAASAEQAFVLAEQRRPDAIVLDVRLPGIDGLTAMGKLQELVGDVPIIVITAYGELSTVVQAVRNGAFEYLVKPFDLPVAQRAVERALQKPQGVSGGPALPSYREIIGSSSAIQEVFKRIAMVAPSEACVHLRGESGTGKELVARAIHRYSQRAEGPFVAVNVASLNPSLAESELFGHAKGAFTGAEHAPKGSWNKPTEARFSWMKWPTSPCRFRSNCCVCWSTARSPRWAETGPCAATSVSSPRRIRTSGRMSPREASARISTSDWLPLRSRFHRSASDGRTSPL